LKGTASKFRIVAVAAVIVVVAAPEHSEVYSQAS